MAFEKEFKILVGIDAVIVAVSGGIDSMVLLSAVHKETQCRVVAVHIDHQLRAESGNEAKFVGQFCEREGIAYHLKKLHLQSKTSIQNRARQQRYAILRKVASEEGIQHILTAHHLDDFAETMLMNLGRGGGISSVAFGATRDFTPFIYVRPFYEISRSRIEKYAKVNEMQWREDPSNEKDVYLRNRIRHTLKDLQEYYGEGLKQSSRRMRDAAEIVKNATIQVWEDMFLEEGPYYIRFKHELAQIEDALLSEFLRYMTIQVFGTTLPEKNIQIAKEAIRKNKTQSISLHGIGIELSKESIVFRKNFGRGQQWWKEVQRECVLSFDPSDKLDTPAQKSFFDYDVEWKGDFQRVEIRGWMPGMLRDGKSVSSLLKNIPKHDRWKVPCVFVEKKLVWIVGQEKKPKNIDTLFFELRSK